ncbi:hypothetical protein BHE74_00004014 [Ensete ventricosum]|nr:hypothetical protein BHE74_00004014 [Ensete ventricosum]RZR77238.1 hypothetical protein BHM03_00002250 [Ensete ventricosum]
MSTHTYCPCNSRTHICLFQDAGTELAAISLLDARHSIASRVRSVHATIIIIDKVSTNPPKNRLHTYKQAVFTNLSPCLVLETAIEISQALN